MTNQIGSELLNTVLQLLTSEGSSGFAEGLRLLVDEALVQKSRHISALLCEISEDWLTAKIYLNMNPADLPLN